MPSGRLGKCFAESNFTATQAPLFMTQPIAQNHQFSFHAQELPQKLAGNLPLVGTGYWQSRFDRLSGRKQPFSWNLGVSNGKAFYSGSQLWTSKALIKLVQRYVSSTRQEAAKFYFSQLQNNGQVQAIPPAQLIDQIIQMGILDKAQLMEALRLKILNDLDTYCLMGAGETRFIPDATLAIQLPIPGFDLQELMAEAVQRQFLWYQLKRYVPAMNLIPIINQEELERSSLPATQQARIKSWVQSGKTLSNIAVGLAKDTLDIAQIFAKLVGAGVVQLAPPTQAAPSTIMIIDDSPLVLMQFQHWVTALGYPVVVCQNAEVAISTISQVKPSAIFIDINMPQISGFELAKQIRQKPQISTIPLVILTGEQKMSNKWRAQWSGCDFLTKPLSMSEVNLFQSQLQELLQRLVASPIVPAVA
jgi:CheY-like chemotaxis protein